MKAVKTNSSNSEAIFNFENTDKAKLDFHIDLFFSSEGYKVKSTTEDKIVFEKGNFILRILFGAFVKYHKISSTVIADNGHFTVTLKKLAVGFSGGAIGVVQANKEFKRITEKFENYSSN